MSRMSSSSAEITGSSAPVSSLSDVLSTQSIDSLAIETVSFAAVNGIVMTDANGLEYVHAPCTLLPTEVTRVVFSEQSALRRLDLLLQSCRSQPRLLGTSKNLPLILTALWTELVAIRRS